MPNESGSDLAKLEYEFATSPNSEAFIPLAEAYLKMGRFVEAMVVCKKGIKAHPDLPIGRLIMARIYSDQAKHQKAIEELNSLLKMSPQNAEAFHLLGMIHLKLGREQEGVDYLKKALDANGDNELVRSELLKRGIDHRATKAEPPKPEVVAAPEEDAVYVLDRPVTRETPAGAVSDPGKPAQPVKAPQGRPAPQVAPGGPPRKRIADVFNEMEERQAKRSHGKKSFKATLSFVCLLIIALAVYTIYSWQAGLRQTEVNKNLEAGRQKFNQDTYQGYKIALEHYRMIVKLDKQHAEGLSRAAFICAVLVNEYGEGRELLPEGDKYLNQASALGQQNSMLTVARGMMLIANGGSRNDAVKQLEKGLKEQPDSALIETALGLVLLDQGDLSEAKEHLMKGAQRSEARALVGLGEYALRRSLYREATQFFGRALQADQNHTRSLLGMVLTHLLRGREVASTEQAQKLLDRFNKEIVGTAAEREKAAVKLYVAIVKLRDPSNQTAQAEVDAALKGLSSNPVALFLAAREMRGLGKTQRARELIQTALRLDSARPDLVLEEASTLLQLRDYEGARSRALRVQAMDTEGGQSMVIVGDAYLAEKNWDKAREYFERALKFDDTAALARLRLGDFYLQNPKQDRDRSQAEYELAIKDLSAMGERRLAAEAAVKAAKIYKEKNRPEEFVAILQRTMTIDASYAPPYAMLALALKLTDAEAREAAKENCKKYLELDPRGEFADDCRKVMAR